LPAINHTALAGMKPERPPMSVTSMSIDIEASPARVFAVLSHVDAWPEWNASVTGIERIGEGPFGAGSRAVVRQPGLRPAVWQVTASIEDARFTWVTASPGLRVTGDHVIASAGAGSRVTLSLRFAGLLAPVLGRMLGRLSRRYLAAEAEGLKMRCEGGSRADMRPATVRHP
jgi:hypothetical protein